MNPSILVSLLVVLIIFACIRYHFKNQREIVRLLKKSVGEKDENPDDKNRPPLSDK